MVPFCIHATCMKNLRPKSKIRFCQNLPTGLPEVVLKFQGSISKNVGEDRFSVNGILRKTRIELSRLLVMHANIVNHFLASF